MERVRMLCPGNYGFPTLRYFAQSQLIRHLDELSPTVMGDLLIRSNRLERRYKSARDGHEKLCRRLLGRKTRTSEALHEMQYKSCKIAEIVHVLSKKANLITDRDLHYVRSELTTLNDLQLGQIVLKQYLDICEVFCDVCITIELTFLVERKECQS